MKKRVLMWNYFWLSLFLLSSCQGKHVVLNQASSTPSGKVASSSESVPSVCADGKTAVILEAGECPGQWILTQEKGTHKNLCTFNYGPAIRCPAGTRSTSYEAVCYGQITKSDFYPDSVLDCSKKLGATPQKSPYKLVCCPQ